jgi:hypothetical protein
VTGRGAESRPPSFLTTEKENFYMPRPLRNLVALLAPFSAILMIFGGSAQGATITPAPSWDVQMVAKPTNFKVGNFAEVGNSYEFLFSNLGGAPMGGPVEVTLKLAPGVTFETEEEGLGTVILGLRSPWSSLGESPRCVPSADKTEAVCKIPNLPMYNTSLTPHVTVSASAAEVLTTEVEVSGGGALETLGRSFTNKVSTQIPPFSITGFESGATGPAGGSETTAGGHPTLLNTRLTAPMKTSFNPGEKFPLPNPSFTPINNSKDIIVDLPVGMVGNPNAAPKCAIQVFLAQRPASSNCPPGSQVGTFAISGGASVFQGEPERLNPIYNLEAEAGYPAELGFYDTGLSHGIVAPAMLAHISNGYVIRVVAPELIAGVFGPYFLQTDFFGNPQRSMGIAGVGAAFLTNPSDCSGTPQRTDLHLDLWADPAVTPLKAGGEHDYAAAEFSDPAWHVASSEAPPVSGCEALHFNPNLTLKPDSTSSDSPTGLGVRISVPQNEEPEGLATPPLRNVTVALPEGLVVNPSSADGLTGCSDAQLAPDSVQSGSCPDGAKLGTVTLDTPLVDHRLSGSVFLGSPECSPCSDADASSGKLLNLYIEINDPATGVVVKLPGKVRSDPRTGRLAATFTENPQLPFESLELHFRSGPRAPLTTPEHCGEYVANSDLTPWSAPQSGPDATRRSPFEISSGPDGSACPQGSTLVNSPAFEAGTVTPLASTYSPFVVKVSRENGSQRISSIDTTLPAGLTGKLAGIPYCSDSAISAASGRSGRGEDSSPSCPTASEVGTVTVGAGSGNPFYVKGHAYLAGPYKGAPLSLEIITPAVAGPFDLGTVAVRTALYVNEYSAQIHAVSDQIPSILAGIPLDVRSIAINLNRPQFSLNPTSCSAMQVLGSTTSTLGQTASLQNKFQVGGCRGLEFKPKLALSLKGPTRRTGHPALKAVVTYPKGGGYANIARAQVSLPHSEFLDQNNIAQACTKTLLTARACPAKSIYGKAKAWTPLLEQPLQGPVYLVGGYGYKLPALVAELNGQIKVLLVGKVDSGPNKGIRNTFEAVPDAPVEKFVLEMKGGKKYGLLINSENICKKKQVAGAAFKAQNGAVEKVSVKIANSCKDGSKNKKVKRHGK